MDALRAAEPPAPGDVAPGNPVVDLALSFPALELPTVELFELCGRSVASRRQLAWLAGRSGLRRAAVDMAGYVEATPEPADDVTRWRSCATSPAPTRPTRSRAAAATRPLRHRTSSSSTTRLRRRRHHRRTRRRVAASGQGTFDFGVGGPVAHRRSLPSSRPTERHYAAWFTTSADEGWRDLHVLAGPPVAGNVLQGRDEHRRRRGTGGGTAHVVARARRAPAAAADGSGASVSSRRR